MKAVNMRKTGLAMFYILLLSHYAAAPLFSNPGFDLRTINSKPPDRYIFRSGAAVDNFENLDSKARMIDAAVVTWQEEGQNRAKLISDYHAVFPIPMEKLIPVFLDHENEDRVYPRITDSRDLSPERDDMEPHYQEVEICFKFLGFGEEYRYILYRVPERLEDGSFLFYWALVNSIDGKYFELYGSWYLEEFVREDKPHTYLRNYIQTGMIDPPAGLKTFTRLFAQKDVRNFFSAVYKAALR